MFKDTEEDVQVRSHSYESVERVTRIGPPGKKVSRSRLGEYEIKVSYACGRPPPLQRRRPRSRPTRPSCRRRRRRRRRRRSASAFGKFCWPSPRRTPSVGRTALHLPRRSRSTGGGWRPPTSTPKTAVAAAPDPADVVAVAAVGDGVDVAAVVGGGKRRAAGAGRAAGR